MLQVKENLQKAYLRIKSLLNYIFFTYGQEDGTKKLVIHL